jgi:hypothetical protein
MVSAELAQERRAAVATHALRRANIGQAGLSWLLNLPQKPL